MSTNATSTRQEGEKGERTRATPARPIPVLGPVRTQMSSFTSCVAGLVCEYELRQHVRMNARTLDCAFGLIH